MREREREEGERERDRQTDTERGHRERQMQRQRETERDRETAREIISATTVAASRKRGSFFRPLVLLCFESSILNYGDNSSVEIHGERLHCSDCVNCILLLFFIKASFVLLIFFLTNNLVTMSFCLFCFLFLFFCFLKLMFSVSANKEDN